MSVNSHTIDTNACKGDSICVDVCPEFIFEMADEKAKVIEGNVGSCILCGQCIAVCPSDAITIDGLSPNLFENLEKWSFEYDDLHAFLSARRSIRNFKDKPVDRELIDKIVKAASTAPMGWPPHTTEILVVDDPDELKQLHAAAYKDYKEIMWAASNPIFKHVVRLKVGAELFKLLREHVLPLAQNANEAFDKNGIDRYMYHTPAIMFFHANRWTASYEENAHIICTYAMLAAQSLGLGTTIIGMMPPILDRSKTLREKYGIPKDNKVITSLILGHPKYKYRKSVSRNFPSVRFNSG